MTAHDGGTLPAETTGWRPQEGDVIEGIVSSVSRAWSDWSQSFYPLVTIRNGKGEDVDVHAFHHTLQARLMEVKPKVGERLEIAYLGKRPTADGKREVAIYKVTAPDATGQEVWDSLERQAPRAAQAAQTGAPAQDDDQHPY